MKSLFTISLIIISTCCFGQLKTVSISELESLMVNEPRPVYLFLHTEWCSICLMMEETTLKDKQIINLLNEHFYCSFFNPEKETVHKKLLPIINTHKIYPSSIFFNSDFEFLAKKEGLLKKEALMEILIAIVN